MGKCTVQLLLVFFPSPRPKKEFFDSFSRRLTQHLSQQLLLRDTDPLSPLPLLQSSWLSKLCSTPSQGKSKKRRSEEASEEAKKKKNRLLTDDSISRWRNQKKIEWDGGKKLVSRQLEDDLPDFQELISLAYAS